MLRIYHHHEKWEDLGMWFNKKFDLNEAIEFTGNTDLYGEYMFKVICNWPITCEHNLTANINRRAWLGHAACYMAIGCPESITRKAWGYLTNDQRINADAKADEAIEVWEWQHHNQGVKSITGAYIDSYLRKGYDFIPDELPGELCELAPSYKFICQAILKNDLHLTSLGYSKPKSEYYNILKRIELDERLRSGQQ